MLPVTQIQIGIFFMYRRAIVLIVWKMKGLKSILPPPSVSPLAKYISKKLANTPPTNFL